MGTFRNIELIITLFLLTLAPTYSAYMYALLPHDVPGYEYEMNLIKKGDESKEEPGKYFMYYKIAMDSIKQKQDKIGEGKDVDLDWMRAYTVYAMARAPSEPEYAEPYLLEAKELAKRYYEIWKDIRFAKLYAVILENLGDIYFNAAESVRKGEAVIVLLRSSITDSDGRKIDKLLVSMDGLYYYTNSYEYKKIITSKNFIDFFHYYEKARDSYKKYFESCEKDAIVKEVTKKYPEVINALTQKACSNLEIINNLFEHQQKESPVKEEEKEKIINKKDVKEKKKETKRN